MSGRRAPRSAIVAMLGVVFASFALLTLGACGRYGPPVRPPAPVAATPTETSSEAGPAVAEPKTATEPEPATASEPTRESEPERDPEEMPEPSESERDERSSAAPDATDATDRGASSSLLGAGAGVPA